MDKATSSSGRGPGEEAGCKRNEELERQVRSRTEELEHEIVRRQKAEAELIRQQEFSRALLESMGAGVVACDAEGVLVLFNRAAKEWHGLDPMRLPPEEWARHYDLFQADGITPLPTEEIPLARAFNGEIVVDAGMAIVAKDQAPRFILANGSEIKDESGKNLGAVVVMRDVTELRRVEEALRKANKELERAVAARTSELETTLARLKAELVERMRAEETVEKERKRMEVLLSALNTGLSLINPDMTIAWVNQKVRDMFPGKEPVGQLCHVFYESRATICERCGTLQAFLDGKVCESEQLVPATGRWYYIVSQPIKDKDGRVVNVLEGITDITERKQAEATLHHLNEELEQRVRERTAELQEKNTKLEQVNRLFVGRELRMVELKERIRELEGELGAR